MSDVEELEARRQSLADIRAAGIDPFPPRTERTHSAAAALAAFDLTLDHEYQDQQPIVTVAGRILSPRLMGKAAFVHIQDASGRVQIYIKRDDVGEEQFALFKRLHPGDFLWARGQMFKTRTGEISVHAREIRILSKALRPMPDLYHGVRDKELRYRKRYLDLIANRESFDRLMERARIITAARHFLDERGFVEVETPILQSLYGGAHARPFTTHYNALDEEYFLRIALELYHKRLLIGGYDKLYEIGRVFRNEGLSRKHNPEFTMLELYWAYADYHDIMELVEHLVSNIATTLNGQPILQQGDRTVDLTPPWSRRTLREAILEGSGIDFAAYPPGDEAARTALRRAAAERGLALPESTPRGKIIDDLLTTFVEPYQIEPVFLLDYPIELSPLAKKKPGDPSLVERFEAFAGGVELANAFTELNDPDDQRSRFEAQQADRAAGDAEAHTYDEEFLEAMEYGMPPAGGLGIGMDRLVMFLTGADHIRDVILFPQLRRTAAQETEIEAIQELERDTGE
jgi:lysyl-tRNA synthetase class 2